MAEALPTAVGLVLCLSVGVPALLLYTMGFNLIWLAYALPIFVGGLATSAMLAGIYVIIWQLDRMREASDFLYEKARKAG